MKKTLVIGLMTAILASTMVPMVYPTPVMAATVKTFRTLTLSRSISGGLNMETKLGVLDKQLDSADRTLKTISDISSQAYQTTKINRDALIQQVDFVKDKVEYDVTTLYQGILNTQKEIELYEKKIVLAKENLNLVNVRIKYNVATALDLTQAEATLTDAEVTLEKAKTNLKDLKKQFLKLTNINIDNYDEMENTIEFEPLEYTGGANAVIDRNVSLYLRSQDELARYKESNILRIAQDNNGGIAPSMTIVASVAADAANTTYQAEQARLNLTNGLNTCYANLVSLQDTLKTLEANKATIERTYETNKVRHQMGQLTDYVLKQSECAVYEMDYNYQKTLTSYLQLKMYFEKPWVK